jgi:hypothetical protein
MFVRNFSSQKRHSGLQYLYLQDVNLILRDEKCGLATKFHVFSLMIKRYHLGNSQIFIRFAAKF